MTLFGKIVFGLTALVVGFGIYYGTSSYVKNDTETGTPIVQNTATSTPVSTSTDVAPSSSSSSGTTTEEKNSEKKMAFPLVLEKGGKYKCDVIQTMGTMTSNGTVYIHDALVRAEFSTSVAGQSLETTMIARKGTIYSWTNLASTTGFKAKMPSANDSSATPSVRTWNGSQVTDYTCEPWVVDDSLFELPKSIVFTDAK